MKDFETNLDKLLTPKRKEWTCWMCDKKCRPLTCCSEECEKKWKLQLAKEEKEREEAEKKRRAQTATIGEVEDMIESAMQNIRVEIDY